MGAGGYDASFSRPAQSDWELVLRLSAGGRRGTLIKEALVTWGSADSVQGTEMFPVVKAVLEKQRPLFESYWREAVLGSENQRRSLQAHLQHDPASQNVPVASSVNWGELRRVEPISAVWGVDRGLPVDRYYIGRFLETNRQDIRGRVLEVKDPAYTQAYGSGVEFNDVVDIAQDNPSATLISDLSAKGSLPEARYDCFILTQTLHIIYEMRNVVANAYRTLRPGGVLLKRYHASVASITNPVWNKINGALRRPPLGDCLKKIFGAGRVSIETHGNVLICSSFLMGLAAAELTPERARLPGSLFSSFDMRAPLSLRQCSSAHDHKHPMHKRKPWCLCITASIGHAETAGNYLFLPRTSPGICAASGALSGQCV